MSAQQRRLAILSAPGSRGDVNPMLAIGRELLRRDFDVAISLAEPYADMATDAGLHAYPLIHREQFEMLLSDPATWKPLRGMTRVIRGVAAGFLRPHFDLIKSLHRPGKTVLVSHPLDFGSRIFRDIDPSTTLVDVHLAPVMLRTPDDPPRLTSWRWEPTRSRRFCQLAYWIGDACVLDPMLAGPINRIRREHGLSSIRRVMDRWWLSPDRVLALYPDWYAPSTVGAVPQLKHVGFPLSDGTDEAFRRPEDKPIVFTGGSANWHTRAFYERAVEACQRLGRSGLLLGGHPDCFPKNLPSTVRPQSYAPLGKLLPDCCAIVHHGGIGTTSQTLRAGIPQIIRPLAFDQFDNADRVERLEAGLCLQSDRALDATLDRVLGDPLIAAATMGMRTRFEGVTPAAEVAAGEIAEVMTVRTGAV